MTTTTTSSLEIREDRLDGLVLARLGSGTPPGSSRALAKSLRSYAPQEIAEPDWIAMVDAALARLRAAGAIDERSRVVDATGLGRVGLRPGTPWRQVIDRHVPAMALGITTGDARALKALSDRDRWAAAMVARAHGLWRDGAPPSPAALGNAIVWRALGLAGTPKPTAPEIRAHFLLQLIDTTPAPPDRLLRLIAAREAGASRADLTSLRQALVRRWLTGAPRSSASVASSSVGVVTPDATPPSGAGDDAFAVAVRDAARAATEGTFGPRKVFIASVWRALRDQPAVRGDDLGAFKRRLVDAHRAGRLVLARADLTAAMDPELVAASEVTDLGARYHFVEREAAS
ncbi:MAG: hypothetical protein KC464_07990 [Myxococcales bacterium]|nr:hypothetical protein [Myxococcales bacterium]